MSRSTDKPRAPSTRGPALACWVRASLGASLGSNLSATLRATLSVGVSVLMLASSASAQIGLGTKYNIATCAELAREPWPLTDTARAALLDRFDAARESCVDNPAFLAFLGAMWLEQGDASQALLWLERSLMLDPDAWGAIADHALALTALGERTALVELAARWHARTDIPAALRSRLEAALVSSTPKPVSRGPFAALKGAGWTWRRTLSVLRGHETNLDHSPRLSEITLSSPDGPIELPLAVPFVPRAARASVAELAVQALHSPQPGTLWQLGVQLGARHAESEPATDTRSAQFDVGLWTQHDRWRTQWQANVLQINGPLSEPYRTVSLGAAAEKDWNGCWNRIAIDIEWRQQQMSKVANSRTTALRGGLNCGLGSKSGWTTGLVARLGLDQAQSPDRPGGQQQQLTLGARAAGPIGNGVRAELAARTTRLRDGEGYSPLLANNALRRQQQTQFSIELSRQFPWFEQPGLEVVMQIQSLRQTSNIKLFEYQGFSAFAGLRVEW